ncbi:hypothetical protein [Streptomyces prunicolor]|uniref:hypothetical protein n=1 Tax=Streptomyces prunicolor TaxID=67348 RepID=UPI000A30E476|nr:hypothetical protein [Streptomyces prunicolor]
MGRRENAGGQERQWITARRGELDALVEELAKQHQEVQAEQDPLAITDIPWVLAARQRPNWVRSSDPSFFGSHQASAFHPRPVCGVPPTENTPAFSSAERMAAVVHLSDYGSAQDLITAALAWFFGPGSLVVITYSVVISALGWRDTGRSVLSFAVTARHRVREFQEIKPSSAGAVAAAYLAVLLLQVVWLVSDYVLGVIISIDAKVGPDIPPAEFARRQGIATVLGDKTPISVGILALGVLCIISAYRKARRGVKADSLAFLFGGLPFVFAIFGLLGAAISAAMWAAGAKNDQANLSTVATLLGCAAVMFVYYLSCQAVMAAPLVLAQSRQRLNMP